MGYPWRVGRPHETDDLQSSLTLLARAQAGDRAALESLITRYLPRLQRWASGRLPRWARDMADTQDLVQETLFQTFKRIEKFEPRGEGALYAYLRQAILNRIREELRRTKRRPARGELDSDKCRMKVDLRWRKRSDTRRSNATSGRWPHCASKIAKRWSQGSSSGTRKQEIADLLGKPTANAARMAVERAIVRLAKEMRSAKA